MYSYLYAYIYGIFFMAEPITLAGLREMFVELLTSGPNSGPKEKPTAPPNDAGKSLADMAKSAAERLGEIAGASVSTVIGLNSIRNPAESFSKAVEGLAKKADTVAGIFGSAAGEAIRYIDYTRKLSVEGGKVGVGQGAGGAAEGMGQAAGYDDLKSTLDAIKKSGNSFRMIGNSADDAYNKFTDFGKQLQGTEIAGKLKTLGLQTGKEIADMAMLAAGGKTDLLETKAGRQKLAEDTALLAAKVHEAANATGKNREEIVAEMLQRKGSADQIQQDRMMNDAQKQSADSARIATLGMGQTMQGITSTIMAGGYLDKTKRTELQVATGGRAGQYMAAVRDNRRTANLAENDPQKIAAKERLNAEIAKANAYQTSSQFNRMAQTTQDPARKAAADKITLENTEADRQRNIMRKNPGMSAVDARKELYERGSMDLQGRTQQGYGQPAGAPGTMNEAGRVSQNMQGLVENFRKNAAGMTISLGELNAEMGRSPDLIRKMSTVGTGGGVLPDGMTQDQATRNAKQNIRTIGKVFGVDSGAEADANKEAGNTDGVKKLRAKTGKREHGTLGETGSPTEPKDIVAKLHKGETVATPEQLRNLMSGSASNAISELMKSATTKTSPGTASTGGNIDISKITSGLKEITTTISSVSGGGSTTRKTVENDDAKTAKKELEAIKAQFQTEKNDLRTQVKGNLGADAKPVDIMRAMRDNPQAKALEARMQEATAKLSERISAGTQIKTSQEAGINRTAINDMSSESMSENISDKLASIKDKKEVEEPEAEQPQFEEPKFEEQSDKVGLKDLNEQLVQLNTSIRQLIEHSAESVETAGKQVRATKGLSGNRFA